MIAVLDVDYRGVGAAAACVVALDWFQGVPLETHVVAVPRVEAYEPGQFYRRELPCLLDVLATLKVQPDIIVVDGYAWLQAGHPGLGAKLHEALQGRTPVVGVAKTRFAGAHSAVEVLRGGSTQPLYVSAAGLDVDVAADYVRRMHGQHRLPTMIKLVDRLCRDAPFDESSSVYQGKTC